VRIVDQGTPLDPISGTDTGNVSAIRKYALLGTLAPAEQRIVRVYFNTSVCADSLKFVTNFGCNYPAGNDIYLNPGVAPNQTIDSVFIRFSSQDPKLMTGSITPKLNVKSLCDTLDVVVELTNVKDANLYNLFAGFKLPAGVKYVANSMKINATNDPAATAFADFSVPSTGIINGANAGDSVIVNLDLVHAYHLSQGHGSSGFYNPGCGLQGPVSEPSTSLNPSYTGVATSGLNRVRVKFRVEFTACPAGTADVITFDARATNYCGKVTTGRAAVNVLYIGEAGSPNTYSCKPASTLPIAICGVKDESIRIYDSIVVQNSPDGPSVATDTMEFTISNDTNNFVMSDFHAQAPWPEPVVSYNSEGRLVVKFGLPFGPNAIPPNGKKTIPLNYLMALKVNNLCKLPKQGCPDIAHSVSFYSVVKLECVAKGISCAGLGAQTKGSGYVPRELVCCASIGNQVWLDNNHDGIQGPGDNGIAGISVTLYQNGPDGLPGTADDIFVSSTATDAYGKYKFENLQPSYGDSTIQYNVGFVAAPNYGFTLSNTPGDNQNDKNSDANPILGSILTGGTGSYDLGPDEYDSTVDAGLYLIPANTQNVGDFVWFDEDKDGFQDPGEKGIAGVVVTLRDALGKVVGSTITDANGKYLFTDVPVGTGYVMQFTPPVGLIGTQQNGAPNDPTNSAMDPLTFKTQPFNVTKGVDELTIDAGFYPQDSTKASIGDKVWYDANNDGIQDPGETGIEEVTVNLLDAGGNVIATTKTDALGNYVFNNLVPGDYAVQFVPLPGLVITPKNAGTDITKDGNADPVTGKTAVVTLKAGDKNMTVDAGMYNPTNTNSIGDRVWFDTDQDGIQDPGEQGLQGVTVKLYDALGNVLFTTMTDVNGNYLFVGLPNGTYSVGFTGIPAGDAISPKNSDNAGLLGADNSDADQVTGKTGPIVLTGGTNVREADCGVYNSGSDGNTGTIGNKVFYDLDNDGRYDGNETGVPNVLVKLYDAGPDGIVGTADDGPIRQRYTDDNGNYLFVGLPAGNYQVTFENFDPGYNPSPQDNIPGNDKQDSDGSPLVAGVSSTVVFPLKGGQNDLTRDLGIYKPNVNSIGNIVWVDANKNGIQDPGEQVMPGVTVKLLNPDGTTYDRYPLEPGIQPYSTSTDETGAYLFTDLPDGSYKVRFSNLPEGYQYTTKDTNSTTNELDSDADPITGITEVVSVAGGQTNLSLDAGIYSTTRAMLGNYVWFDANQDGIQDPTEEGISGIKVTLYDASGNKVAECITDQDGGYLFPNLLPGQYSLGFDNLPGGTFFSPQNVGNDSTDSDVNPATGRTPLITLNAGDVNLTVDAGISAIAPGGLGTTVWEDYNKNGLQDAGEPGVAGVFVKLYDQATNALIGTAVTDGDGNYKFDNLDPSKTYYANFSNLPNDMTFTQVVGPITDALNSDANATTGTTGSITVPKGGFNPNIDAGLIRNFASIGNYVWVDSNADGINNEAPTAGVNGAKVYLLNEAGVRIDSAITANDPITNNPGYYLFDSLRSGKYQVEFPVSVVGGSQLTSQTTTDSTDNNSDANVTTRKSPVVTLDAKGAGQLKDNTTIDAGYYTPAKLGNYVWEDKNGDGVQDSGEPGVKDVVVNLYTNGTDGLPGTADDVFVGTKTTDANGLYLFDSLRPSSSPQTEYNVQFNIPAGSKFTASNTPGDNQNNTNSDVPASTVGTVGKTGSINLKSGETDTTIDAGITLPASLGNVVFLDKDSNGIQDPTDAPIGGVIVKLYTNGADGLPGTADDVLVATDTTDANGNYLFTNLPASKDVTTNYNVGFIRPAGFAPTTQVGAGDNQNNTNSDMNTTPVTGSPNEFRTGSINLASGENDSTIDAGFKEPLKASIGNRVWLDEDKDGIQDAGEPGVAGVTVSLLNASGNVIATTITDGSGNYKFTNLEPGQYGLAFTPPVDYDFTIRTTPLVSDNQNDVNSDVNNTVGATYGKTRLYTLSAGEYDSTADAGLITKITQNVGDKVFFDANKDGLQTPGEEGVAGVTVTLKDASGNVVGTTITNSLGNYLFQNVPAGNGYTIEFTPPIGTVFSPTGVGTDSSIDNNANAKGVTAPFSVVAGKDNLSIDAGIYLQPLDKASVGNKVWEDINNDGIQDPNEPGIAGVTVTLKDANGNVVATTVTNEFGEYIFNNLTPGTYSIAFATPVGYTPSPFTAGLNNPTNSDNNGGSTAPFTLAPGEINTNVDAGFHNTTPSNLYLGDKVWYDNNKDGIQDADEPGVAGVTVQLLNATTGAVLSTTSTDANGNYIFPNLQAGDYKVKFSNLPAGYGLTSKETTPGSATGSDANESGITDVINLTANNTTIDAGIYPQATTKSLASLGDKVWYDNNADGIQDPGETGVANVTVNLLDDLGNVVRSTKTDALGNYIFTGLQPGTYTVEFSNLPTDFIGSPAGVGTDPSKNSDATSSTAGVYETQPIALGAGENNTSVDFGINNPTNNAALGNKVWNDMNNDGIQDANEVGVPGVTVTLYNALGAVIGTTVTDANGEYMFNGLASGTYSVGFSNLPSGYTITPANQGGSTLTDGNANPLSGKTGAITLAPGEINKTIDAGIYNPNLGSIGGLIWDDKNADGIQDANEPPTSGLVVTLKDGTGKVVGVAVTDGNGQYLFTNLPVGDYTVEFTKPDGTIYSPATPPGTTNNDGNTGVAGVSILPGDMNPRHIDAGYSVPVLASVGDFVWYDNNSNGIQDPGEPGVPGVKVTLLNSNGDVVAIAITDEKGHYQINDITPGVNYSINFDNLPAGSEFTAENIPGSTAGNNSDANVITGTTFPFDLLPGQHLPSVDAGLIPRSYLGSFVWNDVDNDGVFDANEKPFPGITVNVYDATGTTIIGTAVTDSLGQWKIEVPGGQSYVIGLDTTTIPAGMHISDINNPINKDDMDNDADRATGKTSPILVPLGAYVSNVWIGINGLAPLGITITLTGDAQGSNNHLVWTVPNQNEIVIYNLEKEIDGIYKSISNQTATISSVAEYMYNDAQVQNTNNYRVRATKSNGEEIYSNIVTLDRSANYFSTIITPNPTINNVDVKFFSTTNGDATIKVYDMSGKLVRTINASVTSGTNTVQVEMSDLASGIYNIVLNNGTDNTYTQAVRKN
jgi:protocatechuate 3,4-dioxygenase beta subunit